MKKVFTRCTAFLLTLLLFAALIPLPPSQAATDFSDLSVKDQARALAVRNSKTKLGKLTTSGRHIDVAWSTVTITGVRYQVAYKIHENLLWKSVILSGTGVTLKKLAKGRVYDVMVRPYIVLGGNVYFGTWTNIGHKRVKLDISAYQVQKNYTHYRIRRGMTKGVYRYVDIDNNGVAEMLYRGPDLMGVYSANKNTAEVRKVREVKGGKDARLVPLYYNKKSHQVMLSKYDSSGGQSWLYSINDTSSKRLRRYKYSNGKFEPKSYQINGKNVSEYRYMSSHESVTGYFTRLIYKPKGM